MSTTHRLPPMKRRVIRAIPAGNLDVGDMVITSGGPREVQFKVTCEGEPEDMKSLIFMGDGFEIGFDEDEPIWIDDECEVDYDPWIPARFDESPAKILARTLYYTLREVTDAIEGTEWFDLPSELDREVRTLVKKVRESGILVPPPQKVD